MLDYSEWYVKETENELEAESFDIEINVPKIYGGKRHFVNQAIDYARRTWMDMGFKEMQGSLVQTSFWTFDALFTPQDHPVREMQDTFFLNNPEKGKLPGIYANVKKMHEEGYGKSKGWQYKFDANKTKQLILRTQGTALSARMLASKELEIPGKYFAIARCFRPDVVDATHSADFNQIEGIVVEEGLSFRHLKGLLKMFAEEFAQAEKIKIKPGYFPFTEPSLELYAQHPKLGWIELGGAGILRPEVVKPLTGKEISVLAWGIGIDRIAMFKLGIKDIRDLFSSDLGALRNSNAFY